MKSLHKLSSKCQISTVQCKMRTEMTKSNTMNMMTKTNLLSSTQDKLAMPLQVRGHPGSEFRTT